MKLERPFRRSASNRVVAGVAGGLGERLRIDPIVIRLAFGVLAFAAGAGVVLYLAGWLLSGEESRAATVREQPDRATAIRNVFVVGLVTSGVLVLLREARLWVGDALMWSVGLSAFGSALLWTRGESVEGPVGRFLARFPRAPADVLADLPRGRLLAGTGLVAAGMGIFLATNTDLSSIGPVIAAVSVTAGGLGLVLGPWVYALVQRLGEERRERIRSEERAEVAAHLHDSVLQTLAMIQRTGSPEEMAALARTQERELRAWLYGRARTSASGAQMLSAALDELAGRVEAMHQVTVETVIVGDAPVDERVRAVLDAAHEAATNAAKHSGTANVSVYAEVSDDEIHLYVRDDGAGFDPAALPTDRAGISESIVGRMERNGGTATITSAPADGTEVHLVIARRT